jgi:hypothetical protein
MVPKKSCREKPAPACRLEIECGSKAPAEAAGANLRCQVSDVRCPERLSIFDLGKSHLAC